MAPLPRASTEQRTEQSGWHLTLFELCSSTGSFRVPLHRGEHHVGTRKPDPSLPSRR
jgi:hypothetical protein